MYINYRVVVWSFSSLFTVSFDSVINVDIKKEKFINEFLFFFFLFET